MVKEHSEDLISVTISSYNHGSYIQECIKSIISQSYKNLELIIVDDCSSDDTVSKIKDLKDICKKRFIRFQLIENDKNRGTCNNMNKLINESKGNFLYYIASDDVICDPRAIEILYKAIKHDNNCGFAVGDNDFIDGSSDKCCLDSNYNISYKKTDKNFDSFMRFNLRNRDDVFIGSKNFFNYASFLIGNYITNGYLIRREVYGNEGFFTTSSPLEDWHLALQISKKWKMIFCDKILFSYRRHPINTSADRKVMISLSKKTRKYEKYLLEKPENKQFKKVAKKFRVTKKRDYGILLKKITYENFYEKRKVFYLFGFVPVVIIAKILT